MVLWEWMFWFILRPNKVVLGRSVYHYSFFGKNGIFSQSNSVRAVLKIFCFCFRFLLDLLNYKSCIQNLGSQLEIHWKNDSGVIICRHDVVGKVFWHHRISLVKFRKWFKFHVNIIGSGFMTIFVYKGFDQKSRNWKYVLLIFAQYLETGARQQYQIWHVCFNKTLLNAAKYQGCSFYRFWVIKVKAIGEVKIGRRLFNIFLNDLFSCLTKKVLRNFPDNSTMFLLVKIYLVYCHTLEKRDRTGSKLV